MNPITAQLQKWWAEEPVLTRIGPLIVAIGIYLAARGQIDSDTVDLIVALAAFLGGGGALAATRANVTPWTPPTDPDGGPR